MSHHHNLVRVAAAVPQLRLADPEFNAQETCRLLSRAQSQGVNVVVFPELGLTGYTCHDLFHTQSLPQAAATALENVRRHTRTDYRGVAIVGLPIILDGGLFNCAAVIHQGQVLGLVPKSYLPNYKEFYDARYFSPACAACSRMTRDGIPFGTDLLFDCENWPELTLGVEICEDLWVPTPPSSDQARRGATLLTNLSASNEAVGKSAYRRQLVVGQSARCLAGYVYAAAGTGESTTDLVFGGHALIAENGLILAETQRFQPKSQLLIADIDLDRLTHDRMQTTTFNDSRLGTTEFRRIRFHLDISPRNPPLARAIDGRPFVPQDRLTLHERCHEIFHIQVTGLARRLEHLGLPSPVIGVSGGLDSTLALLVLCKTLDALGKPRTHAHAFTLPGFGTSQRTLANARGLMKTLGVRAREIDIRSLCLEQMTALGHAPFGIPLEGHTVESLTEKLRTLPTQDRQDLVFENIQARVRTSLLMNAGFVVGTGDLSELALGWCTYNADHMSMYNPNVSVPKTLVKFLVEWAAENEFDGEARRLLRDVVATEISPELLPTNERGEIAQLTESVIGPYELHDFFLYHLLRFGLGPEKILFLAEHARFETPYSPVELRQWLKVFVRRFFANQFKRSCLPDGPKVGSVSLSPRGDWRMPSDAVADTWLKWLDNE